MWHLTRSFDYHLIHSFSTSVEGLGYYTKFGFCKGWGRWCAYDEDGGSGVWIGRKLTRNALSRVVERVRETPGRFILQEFEHLSVLENRIVDLRIHAHVDCERVIVSKTPWGRAKWLGGDGKVNIGAGGFASPVVVVRDPRRMKSGVIK